MTAQTQKSSATATISVPTSEGRIDIEYRQIGCQDETRPLIVFLHEGLGSVSMWGDWPEQLCLATGCRGLLFSRYGYGNSSARPSGPWPLDYLEREASEMLPALFRALGITPENEKLILFGHSDGGTIALLFASMYPQLPRAIIAVAPHVNVEDIALSRIGSLQEDFGNGKLAAVLGKHHPDPASVFWGWSNVWRSAAFRNWDITACLDRIECRTLAIQGTEDQYATPEQIAAIQRQVRQASVVFLENCRHVPHQEQPEKLLGIVAEYIAPVGD